MKNSKTISEQIEILKDRNLIITNNSFAEYHLFTKNYYRLSGYWRNFQISPDTDNNIFIDGTTFEQIIDIYNLDEQLRNILQKGIGIFEISFRTNFAYQVSLNDKNGINYLEYDFYDNNILSKNEKTEDLLISINKDLSRSKEKFIKSFADKKEKVPIWAAVEVISFGNVSKMFSRCIYAGILKDVSNSYKSLKGYKHTKEIVRALVNLRNLCAHQSRIWNREAIARVPDKKYFQKFGESASRSHWRIISVLMLLVDDINRNDSFSKSVIDLCRINNDFYIGLTKPTL